MTAISGSEHDSLVGQYLHSKSAQRLPDLSTYQRTQIKVNELAGKVYENS